MEYLVHQSIHDDVLFLTNLPLSVGLGPISHFYSKGALPSVYQNYSDGSFPKSLLPSRILTLVYNLKSLTTGISFENYCILSSSFYFFPLSHYPDHSR